MISELAVETSISPRELIELDGAWLATMLDVLEERAKQVK
jgi:hypothetical protein